MSISQTLELLDALNRLGFNDEAFWRLHHFRARNHKETISSFRSYCEKQYAKKAEFAPAGTNDLVCERLAFVLKTYQERGLSSGQTAVFTALADASFFAIPPR